MENSKFKALFVDDEKDNLEVFKFVLGEMWDVTVTDDAEEIFADAYKLWTFDVVFLDLVMPDPQSDRRPKQLADRSGYHPLSRPDPSVGFRTLIRLRDQWPHIQPIVHSGLPYDMVANYFEKFFQDVPYLEKPVDFWQTRLHKKIEKMAHDRQEEWKAAMKESQGEFH